MTRKVSIAGSMFVFDHDWPDGSESQSFNFQNTVFVGSEAPLDLLRKEGCVDNEVRAELHLTVKLASDEGIMIDGQLKLYEGASCSTNDLDGQTTVAFFVPKDQVRSFSLRLQNTDEGGDFIDLTMTVKNTAVAP
jgi:hypothetical protein